MRIEIDTCVANDSDAHNWLDRILYKIEDGWHVWDTTNQLESDFESTTWIRGRGLDARKRVHELLVASIQQNAWGLGPHGRHVRVTERPNATNELKPEDAVRLTEEPLWILVENRYSDGAFVKRIVDELDESLSGLWNQPGEPIRFDSLGGSGQMEREVRNRIQSVPFRPRLIVIVDSDRKAPNTSESTAAKKLYKVCTNLNVPCWVLAKREAENYLPRALLRECMSSKANGNQLVEAWDRLTDDQKNFFDMKKGFASPSNNEPQLFQGLSETDKNILNRGFGEDVRECWTCSDEQVMAELRNRSQGDLEHGIALICKEV